MSDEFIGTFCAMLITACLSCMITRHTDEKEFVPKLVEAYNAGLHDAPHADVKLPSKPSCTPAQAAVWWTGTNLVSAKKKLCKRSMT